MLSVSTSSETLPGTIVNLGLEVVSICVSNVKFRDTQSKWMASRRVAFLLSKTPHHAPFFIDFASSGSEYPLISPMELEDA